MKWSFKEPRSGDIIRMKFGELYHYGVYVSDEEVIQFGLAPSLRSGVRDSDVRVLSSDIDGFLGGAFLEVAELDKKEEKRRRPPAETVEYARGRIGEGGYNILHNNCEHFANECVFGEKFCSQSDAVRQMLRSLPVLDVYIAEIPSDTELQAVYPKERESEIALASNERVKREKYYAWRLLEYGMERSFGIKLKKAKLEKSECGKWHSPLCEFSLSHSGNYCVVALSRTPVGVDLEQIKEPRSFAFAEKILTTAELLELSAVPEAEKCAFLIRKWSEKESVFKSRGEAVFIPASIDTGTQSVRSEILELGGEQYALAVSSSALKRYRVFKGIVL